MSIKGLAFDLEGTIVDLESAHHFGHLAMAKEVGVTLTLEEALKQLPHFIGGPDDKICEEIWILSDRRQPLAQLIERDKIHYQRLLKELVIAPRPGFLDFLAEARKAGLKTAVGSLTATAEAEWILKRSGLADLFEGHSVVLREDVKNVKPSPDVFLETARRMGIEPGEQLVFEDSPHGVEAARRAGSEAIGLPVYNNPELLQRLSKAGSKAVYLGWEDLVLDDLLAKF